MDATTPPPPAVTPFTPANGFDADVIVVGRDGRGIAMTERPYTSVWSDLAQVEFSQGFLQAGPYRTRYLHAGDDSKPVLLLLHGITGHAEAYVRNLAAHAEHFSVWAIDFIGH